MMRRAYLMGGNAVLLLIRKASKEGHGARLQAINADLLEPVREGMQAIAGARSAIAKASVRPPK